MSGKSAEICPRLGRGGDRRWSQAGTDKAEGNQEFIDLVPGVPAVPASEKHIIEREQQAAERTRFALDWDLQERAAILEFDGGMTREDAEVLAISELAG